MAFDVCILGFNSAIPTTHSHPTAQLVNIDERLFLVDCGEGTQVQLRKAKAKFSKIDHIFISHMHGDHVFGLIGLLSTFHLLGREKDMHIYGPMGIKSFITHQLKLTGTHKKFNLVFHELSSTESELIYEDKKLEIRTIPLSHRIYCNGFLFKEKPKLRGLNMEAINLYPEIQTCDYPNLKNGVDFTTKDGDVIANTSLTNEPKPSKSYAYCSDTMFYEKIIPLIQKVDLLYHEATFLNDLEDLAKKTGHSTALQAGKIAQKAQAKKLVLGHFSNRYPDYNVLKHEAESVFDKEVFIPELLQVFSL